MRTTLTAFMPAHKQTNPEHKPGQVVNPLGFAIQPTEQTLGQYINRVKRGDAFDQVAAEKKLTFKEWAEESQIPYRSVETIDDLWDYTEMAWKAALAVGR